MGEWIKRKADEHKHDMPKGLSTDAELGDVWKCACGNEFKIVELKLHTADPLDQRESDWKTAEWEKVS